MDAIILAGGFGTRLQSIVRDVPKPMADIQGKPFLAYLIEYLARQGFNKVLLSVGYKHEIITTFFKKQYNTTTIEYVIEDTPLGTGGAIRESLRHMPGDVAVVLNGDTFFDVALNDMYSFHRKQNTSLSIAVKPMHNFDRYGSIVLDGNKIITFEEKTFKKFGYINGGIYIINKSVLDSLDQYKGRFSFEADFLAKIVYTFTPSAFISEGYFVDIGIPEDYKKAQIDLVRIGRERTV